MDWQFLHFYSISVNNNWEPLDMFQTIIEISVFLIIVLWTYLRPWGEGYKLNVCIDIKTYKVIKKLNWKEFADTKKDKSSIFLFHRCTDPL